MLKKRFAVTAIAVALIATLSPALSEAAPRATKARPAITLDLFAKLTRFWNLTLGTSESNAWQKNGPGIDPQGKPLCTIDCDPINPIGNGGGSEDPADAGL